MSPPPGRIAFLGAGRMASALVRGLLAQGAASPAALACLGGEDATGAELAARTGIGLARSSEELLAGADTLVVAFKPQNLAGADPRLAELTAGRLVLSILAGKRLATLRRTFPRARNLVRCMPNTPAQIGAGITAWSADRPLDPGDRATVETLLAALGRAVEVPEPQLDAVTGLSGSGPAYVFEFAGALRDAGAAAGLEPAVAEALAVATLLGSARLLEQRGGPPERLRDEVVSPGGTTQAGLERLAAGGFRDLIRETVRAATARSAELARD
jgi:pyrroline-5-carboxylate reductase